MIKILSQNMSDYYVSPQVSPSTQTLRDFIKNDALLIIYQSWKVFYESQFSKS